MANNVKEIIPETLTGRTLKIPTTKNVHFYSDFLKNFQQFDSTLNPHYSILLFIQSQTVLWV